LRKTEEEAHVTDIQNGLNKDKILSDQLELSFGDIEQINKSQDNTPGQTNLKQVLLSDSQISDDESFNAKKLTDISDSRKLLDESDDTDIQNAFKNAKILAGELELSEKDGVVVNKSDGKSGNDIKLDLIGLSDSQISQSDKLALDNLKNA